MTTDPILEGTTPGPWVVQVDKGTRAMDHSVRWHGFILAMDGTVVARYLDPADAPLIASAPDLAREVAELRERLANEERVKDEIVDERDRYKEVAAEHWDHDEQWCFGCHEYLDKCSARAALSPDAGHVFEPDSIDAGPVGCRRRDRPIAEHPGPDTGEGS